MLPMAGRLLGCPGTLLAEYCPPFQSAQGRWLIAPPLTAKAEAFVMSTLQFPRHRKKDVDRYIKSGWWSGVTFGDMLDKTVGLYPTKEALVDDRVRLTYSELQERVNRLALGFMDLGIKSQEPVLLQLPNWAEFVYAFFALQKIGSVPVLLIPGYLQLEVSHLCQLTGARAWIVPDVYRKINYLSVISEVKRTNSPLTNIISVRASRESGLFTTSLERVMEREISADDRRRLAARMPESTAVAHILPSGGTTGLPKAITRTHNDYLCNVEYIARAGEMSRDDTWMVIAPVSHNQGLLVGVSGSIFMGGKLVLLDSTRPEDICGTIQRERVTFMPVVPSLIKRIVNFEGLGDYNLSSWQRLSAGGEASSPELVRQVEQKIGCKYINEFGMSEGLLCRSRLSDGFEVVGNTVGKPCCPGDEVKILDEGGKELPLNIDGELSARGPGIFAGYLKNPEENSRVFTADGFFRTGDLARIDDSGNITITGRIKDVIIRGGENISPTQVEDVLLSHPDIADVAVIGLPDEELGERVCAYIQPVAGAKLDPEKLKAFMEDKGASKLLIPERFEFIDALPMTEAGKHNKRKLREDIERRLGNPHQ